MCCSLCVLWFVGSFLVCYFVFGVALWLLLCAVVCCCLVFGVCCALFVVVCCLRGVLFLGVSLFDVLLFILVCLFVV